MPQSVANKIGAKLKYLYAIDGDDIGKKLESFLFKEKLIEASTFSKKVEDALHEISIHFTRPGAKILFLAGDSVMLETDSRIPIPIQLLNYENFTFSVGIGSTGANAVLALKKAKGLGKNRVEELL